VSETEREREIERKERKAEIGSVIMGNIRRFVKNKDIVFVLERDIMEAIGEGVWKRENTIN
jgi:hypothetical protein